MDLLSWREGRAEATEVLYWRTATGEEVDFVIETPHALIPIEVKATTRPRLSEARSLQTFQDEYGKNSRPGLLLHTGSRVEWLAPRILAAPWWRVL